MRNQVDLLATVTVLGVLEQAYFALQVIYARRKYKISPPETTGHPEFERIFRAQANCSEYFPIFVSLLWVAGIFFHQGWDRCTPAPGCSGCCWGWRWPVSWHTSHCPAPRHGRQRWRGPSSCLVPRERGRGAAKPTTGPGLAWCGQRPSISRALRSPSAGGRCWHSSACEAPLFSENFSSRRQTLPSLCPS
ncbi:leukotriene C4 synthase isoform X1 [Opisthocomus hoazin]|uniref:leukotriene C4 synthase isoform X1 n=1 Tax=Opisthocomus hoazin TaxID=30419 RepID=UPI003F52DED1